jgi:hypothetical protein
MGLADLPESQNIALVTAVDIVYINSCESVSCFDPAGRQEFNERVR